MTDHREIWLNCKCSEGHGREWCQDPVFARCEECGAEPVKYIRADLACLLDKPEAGEVVTENMRVAASSQSTITTKACGGCGATDPSQRCIGCLHSFFDGDWPEQMSVNKAAFQEIPE